MTIYAHALTFFCEHAHIIIEMYIANAIAKNAKKQMNINFFNDRNGEKSLKTRFNQVCTHVSRPAPEITAS